MSARAQVAARAAGRRRSASAAVQQVTLDADAFMADLLVHLQRMEVETEDALVRTGLKVQSTARGLCPVDTGRLRSSIVMRKGRDGLGFYVEIGTNVSYAPFVEFGTSRMAARPFLLPAVAQATGFLRAEAGS